MHVFKNHMDTLTELWVSLQEDTCRIFDSLPDMIHHSGCFRNRQNGNSLSLHLLHHTPLAGLPSATALSRASSALAPGHRRAPDPPQTDASWPLARSVPGLSTESPLHTPHPVLVASGSSRPLSPSQAFPLLEMFPSLRHHGTVFTFFLVLTVRSCSVSPFQRSVGTVLPILAVTTLEVHFSSGLLLAASEGV